MNWRKAILFVAGSVACFHIAYSSINFAPLRLFIIGYVICLVQLTRLKTIRQSFYAGLITGFLCGAPQLGFFWNIFHQAAIVLWIICAFWIAAFVGLTHAAIARFGLNRAALLTPFIWTGLEYFRSELYYLKFSWLNVGYAFANFQMFPFHILGMYGVGFLVATIAVLFLVLRWIYATLILAIILVLSAFFMPAFADNKSQPPQLQIAGVQLEFPSEYIILQALNQLMAKHPEANVLVLSEYTVDGTVPDSLKNWCRTNNRYLVIGGKDPATNNNYYNTVFVVGPKGEIIFRQAKSVPIQFFIDGLPAPQQAVWDSPWGKIGICICYDLSYSRVTDRLVKLGAQLLIVPTMDVTEWGKYEHQLHALVAPVRAAEYGVPIFRLASSGISQAVNQSGNVIASAPFLGQNKTLIAGFKLPPKGTLPLDRFLAPLSVGVTVLVLIAISLGFPKMKRMQ